MYSKKQMNRHPAKPQFESLEDRRVLTTFVVTNLNDAGEGSLRQAIVDANAAEGADTIEFADDVRGTIELTSGQLEITDDLTIDGPGAAELSISGGGISRVFHVTEASSGINDVTITGGQAPVGPAGPLDVTSSFGGGLYNLSGTVSLRDVHFVGNEASGANWAAAGAIANLHGAVMTVSDSVFSNNRAAGIHFGVGGAINNDAGSTITIRNSTFTENEAIAIDAAVPEGLPSGGMAGALVNASGSTARIFSTDFHNNIAQGADGADGVAEGENGQDGTRADGSALFNSTPSLIAPPAPSTMYVADSSFIENHSIGGNGGDGAVGGNGGNGPFATTGAVRVSGVGEATFVRSTFVGNTVDAGDGGNGGEGGNGGNGGLAVGSVFFMLSSELTVINSELRDNVTLGGNGGNGGQGGSGGDGALLTSGAVLVAYDGAPSSPHVAANFIGSSVVDNVAVGGNGGAAGADGERSGNGGRVHGGGFSVDPGLFTEGERPPTTLTITNSQIVGNTVQGGIGGPGAEAGSAFGGGVSNWTIDPSVTATLRIRNTTVTENVAIDGTGADGVARGGGLNNEGVLDATERDLDHIFANVAADCHDAFIGEACTDNDVRDGAPAGEPALLGDLNGDGSVDRADDAIMARALTSGMANHSSLDLNDDGAVDATDSTFLAETLIGGLRGDTDLDGDVDFNDFLRLSENFGATDAVWGHGDFDGDGEVGFTDFLALSANFGSTL